MQTFIIRELLNPKTLSINEYQYDTLIEYLQDKFPNGFDKNCTITVNNDEIPIDNYDMRLGNNDIVTLVFHQGIAAAIGITNIWAAIAVNLAVSVAASYVIGQIFRPDLPKGLGSRRDTNSGQASTTYNLNSNQNQAKLGQPIPVIYGRVRTYPALIAKPFYRYENNDLYMYQLMCVGQGEYDIESVMISDTPTTDFAPDIFNYVRIPPLENSNIESFIQSQTGDLNYRQFVTELEEVSSLEIRGTPEDNILSLGVTGSVITFYKRSDGSYPDLSGLQPGTSTISLSGMDNSANNGVFNVIATDNNAHTVTVSQTFITEPTDTASFSDLEFISNSNRSWGLWGYFFGDATPISGFGVKGDVWEITSATPSVNLGEYTIISTDYFNSYLYEDILDQAYTNINLSRKAKFATVGMQIPYGPYYIGETDGNWDYVEVDIEFPRGLYNSDVNGNFTNRNVDLNINVKYPTFGAPPPGGCFNTLTTFSGEDSSPIRQTVKVTRTCPAVVGQPAYLYINRDDGTPESSDIKSQDRPVVTRIKTVYLQSSIDTSKYGDVMLLWAKAKASNGLSNIGQFSINAWVNRNDVANDVNSVLTDVYTNTTYGGRLPASELDLPTTTETINGAIDAPSNVFDVMRMVGKAQRYSVFPVGAQVTARKDDVKPLRAYMFNETNIIKDSLKISYLFEEEDTNDSIQVKYRDSENFKEQSEYYPSGGFYPEIIELWGCTDQATALSMATYLFKQDRARRKTIEFQTDEQGLIPQLLDRIAISHNIPKWGDAGRVVAVNGNQITVDCNSTVFENYVPQCSDVLPCDFVAPCDFKYNTIIFIDDTGKPSAEFGITVVSAGVLELDATPPTWIYTGYDKDKTAFSLGTTTTTVKDYIITNVRPASSNRITIQATNYDESIYS